MEPRKKKLFCNHIISEGRKGVARTQKRAARVESARTAFIK